MQVLGLKNVGSVREGHLEKGGLPPLPNDRQKVFNITKRRSLRRFASQHLTGGCSDGLNAFRFFFEKNVTRGASLASYQSKQ